MSNEAINWVLKLPKERVPSSSAKFVLFVLANQCASDQAFASIAYIEGVTGQDRKTVLANIARLLEWRLMVDTGERRGKTGQIPVYRLALGAELFDAQAHHSNSPKNGTVPKTGPIPKAEGNSPNFPRQQSQKRDTEPKEPKEPNSRSARERVTECAKAMIAAGFPAIRINHSTPLLVAAADECTAQELADVVTEVLARGGAPPNLAYVCTTALNRRRDEAARRETPDGNPTQTRRGRRTSLADAAADRARAIFANSAGTDDADPAGADGTVVVHDGRVRASLDDAVR